MLTSKSDDHHYRHILVTQIRKVWNDSNSDSPKQYSYAEWAYYLRLLGEDENDSSFHRRPPKTRAADDLEERKKVADHRKGSAAGNVDSTTAGAAKKKDNMTKWSWMGPRSPLMAGDDEPSWLLEKLFAKLEESLTEHWEEHKKQDKEGKEPHKDDADDSDQSGASEQRPTAPAGNEADYEKDVENELGYKAEGR